MAVNQAMPWGIRSNWTYGPQSRLRFANKQQQSKRLFAHSARRGGARTTNYPSDAPVEKNVRDTVFEDLPMSLTWAGGELSFCLMPVQGTDFAKRTGNFINVHSVYTRFRLEKPAIENAGGPEPDLAWTVALVWDKQTNGATLNAEDVYNTTGTVPETESFRNIKFSKRFKVLHKWEGILQIGRTSTFESANNYSSATVSSDFMECYYKFPKGLRCQLDGNSGGITDVQDHSFHLIGVGESTLINVSGNSRIRFTSA